MMFQPSPLSYGASDDGAGIATAIEQYAPVIQSVAESVSDASRNVEVLRAQIDNTKQMMRNQPWLRGALQMRLRKLKARLAAAERRQEKQRESESSTRTYRALGQAGVVVGIGVGLAIIIRLLRR
jgi:chromosome segregation ATPase